MRHTLGAVFIKMTTQAVCWSKEYLAAPGAEDPMTAQIDQRLWQEQIHNDYQGRLFVRIRASSEQQWIAPIGLPVDSNPYEFEHDPIHRIYLPVWMIDSAKLEGLGEQVELEFLDNRDFESATRIVLRVVDSRFYNDQNIKERLETILTDLGVIRKNTLIQVPCGNGETADIYISATEPSEYVLCQGEEVVLEFEEPVDSVPSPPSPPSPIPSPPETLSTLSTDYFQPPPPTDNTFSGTGYRLGNGGEHVTLPPWRLPGIRSRP
jgi:hypothetical protein